MLWLAFMYLYAISSGAYVTGRLHPKVADAKVEEVEFRDGINGVVMWGVGMIVSALFTIFSLTAAVGTVASTVGPAVGAAASTAASAAAPHADYFADLFLRSTTAAPGATPRSDTEVRAEIGRILAAGVYAGKLTDGDRQYLATLVGRATGLPEAEARTRVDANIAEATRLRNEAAAKAQAAAEAARKLAAQAGFWVAVLSLLSGIAAWYSAQLGGRHRDAGRYR